MKAPIQERQRHTSPFDLNLLTYEVLVFRRDGMGISHVVLGRFPRCPTFARHGRLKELRQRDAELTTRADKSAISMRSNRPRFPPRCSTSAPGFTSNDNAKLLTR